MPGGDPSALKLLMSGRNRAYIDFLVKQAKNAHFVCSVCEGALLLAVAGLLDGFEATTHWSFVPCLKQFPKIKVAEGHPRFVVDGNRVTGGGISSGLDEAFKLVELIASYGPRPAGPAGDAVLSGPAGGEHPAARGRVPVQLVALRVSCRPATRVLRRRVTNDCRGSSNLEKARPRWTRDRVARRRRTRRLVR